MPYSMCSMCGQISHISVGDVKEWYEKYYPEIPLGTMVPGQCFYCWPELKLGDSVVIRQVATEVQDVHKGEIGVITDILTSKDGSVFAVRTEAGKELYFIRAQLRKIRESEVSPNVVVD